MKIMAPGLCAIALLAVALGIASKLPAAPDDAVTRGREYVEARCIGCHAGNGLDVAVKKRLDSRDPDALDRFLAKHHVADASLRPDVVLYLEARLEASSGP